MMLRLQFRSSSLLVFFFFFGIPTFFQTPFIPLLIFTPTTASEAHTVHSSALSGLPFNRFVIQPCCIHPLLHSSTSIPVSVSDLSRLCEGKGFSVGNGCLYRRENETHTHIYKKTCRHMYTQSQTKTHTHTHACSL